MKDAAGNTIFTGVTQDRLILEPGAYTVEIALESDRYEVSDATQTYAMSLYVESDFFEFALRDETRGARVDATYPAYAYAYDRSTGAFTVSAWYGTALGAYTFYGFALQDNTDGANLDLTGMTFSLTGEEGSFVSLEALNFRADKPGQYTLYYRMTGTAEGKPVAGGGAVTLDIQPIDLASVIDARLDVEEGIRSIPIMKSSTMATRHKPPTSSFLTPCSHRGVGRLPAQPGGPDCDFHRPQRRIPYRRRGFADGRWFELVGDHGSSRSVG